MKLNRDYITPYLTWTFVVIGVTGLLMFFHVLDGYTEVVHELLGLLFVLFSIFHVILNWKGLKKHFKKRKFKVSLLVILLLSVLFIYVGKGHGEHERIIMEKLSKAPLSQTFEILDIKYSEVSILLKEENIRIGDAQSIEEIALKNEKTPKEIIELILK